MVGLFILYSNQHLSAKGPLTLPGSQGLLNLAKKKVYMQGRQPMTVTGGTRFAIMPPRLALYPLHAGQPMRSAVYDHLTADFLKTTLDADTSLL
jgi:hypothetical protein